MEADAAPSSSIAAPLRAAWTAGRHVLSRAARLALDVALPTLCVSCREPVDGEGVCAAVVHRTALLPTARHSLCVRSRSRHAVDGGDREPAGLPAGARRGAL